MAYNVHVLKVNNSAQLLQEMNKIGADEAGIHLMLPKAETILIKIQNINLKAANLLKQEMLAKGGDLVVHKQVSMLKKDISDAILIGTTKQYWALMQKLKVQPFGLKDLGKELEQVLKAEVKISRQKNLEAKEHILNIDKKTLVMGILNVTPDSFSDGGNYNHIEAAVNHAKEMVEMGADIIDIGGESTRPGHKSVTLDEELKRVIPIIERITKEVNVPISIDTYKAEVAKQAIEAGAHIINDVWGFKKDINIASVAAELNVPVILMHNRTNNVYNSFIDDVISDLRESIDIATKAGVKKDKIILDPGIGFAKSYEGNLKLMNRLDQIVALGFPVLLGTSRKSMIGLTLDLPVNERVEGTAATVALGIAKGCKIVRVHDVKEIARVAKMMDAMVYVE